MPLEQREGLDLVEHFGEQTGEVSFISIRALGLLYKRFAVQPDGDRRGSGTNSRGYAPKQFMPTKLDVWRTRLRFFVHHFHEKQNTGIRVAKLARIIRTWVVEKCTATLGCMSSSRQASWEGAVPMSWPRRVAVPMARLLKARALSEHGISIGIQKVLMIPYPEEEFVAFERDGSTGGAHGAVEGYS